MSEYLKRLQARDSRIGCVNSSTDVRMCSLIGCHERIRGAQDAFGLPIPCATQESFAAPPSKQRALIIASPGCYELASAQAHAAGIHDVTLAPAVHGTEAGRSPADGVVQAHRGVWRSILQAGRPGIVLEEDAHFIGDRTDVTSALARCEAVGCDLAYLGIAGDVRCAYRLESTVAPFPIAPKPFAPLCAQFFLSHAYLATPRAAHYLLDHATSENGNKRKADYAMRLACLGEALAACLWSKPRLGAACDHANLTIRSPPPLRCLRPPRVLWRRPMEGIGIFVQNHFSLTSYATLAEWNQAKMAKMNRTERQLLLTALRERKCKQQHMTLKRAGYFSASEHQNEQRTVSGLMQAM